MNLYVALGWLASISCNASWGRYSSEDAKITGMTPAWLTFSGMYVEVPPYIRRPTMRLAYCTGTRRCACSMKTTAVITMIPRAMMNEKTHQPLPSLTLHPSAGNRAAIEVKIRTDMPLPTPRSVIISPSHMITPVPAVIVSTSTETVSHIGTAVCGTIGYWAWSHLLLNSCPERASATNAEDWRMARPRVR